MKGRPFPVYDAPEGCPASVTWSSLNLDHAERVHSSTLVRLAQRGGMTPIEIFGNVRRIPAREYGRIKLAEALDLVKRIAYEES